ncbi:phosphatase PAP2 family protein [Pedobacter aquatilis]|uniref:phosphatase PAP2 family protein n=1 Tax=Pedobacter aquatilis TaxID=351343 RepID=UPI00292E0F6E|nr:phosphatase PAP2 family protein [Pedobacter aquatilis]
MIKRIRRLPFYFSALATFIILALAFLLIYTKPEGFLILNHYHSSFLDIFFSLITNLGDGLLCIFFAIVLFIFKKKKKAITLLLAYTSSGIIAQVAKSFFNMPRPRLLLEQLNIAYSSYVPGVKLHDFHSFPSGHTTSAFALSTVLVLVFKKNKISVPCLLLAILVGYSRIYLAQHFPIDVLAGAVLGVACAALSYYQVYSLKLFRSLKATKRFRKLKQAETVSKLA